MGNRILTSRRVHWLRPNPFSGWVLPLRAGGAVLLLLALARMLVNVDLSAAALGLTGVLLWQLGTFAEEQSPLHARLSAATLRDVMRAQQIKTPVATPVSALLREHPDLGSDDFVVTTYDGCNVGIALPDDLLAPSEFDSRYRSAGEVAHQLDIVHALRPEDALLAAFRQFRKRPEPTIAIVDRSEALVGVLTRDDLLRWIEHPRAPRAKNVTSSEEAQATKHLTGAHSM